VTVAILFLALAGPGSTAPWPPAHVPGWRQHSYWDSRQIVTIAAYRSHGGTLDSTVVIDNAGRAASADSVRRLTERALRMRTGNRVEFVQVALDSSARWFPGRQGLPEFAVRGFKSGHFREWAHALDPRNPERALNGFIAQTADTLVAPGIPHALKERHVKQREARGLLATSPDSSYVLDPFATTEISSTGAVGHDDVGGYALFDRKSGDVRASVGAGVSFDLGGWISKDQFLLVGRMRVDSPVHYHGEQPFVIAPVIVVGDVNRRVAATYFGRPIDSATSSRLTSVRSAAYPQVKW
jgi:hypothetical protein